MSHLLEFAIPIRLQCYRVPAVWRCEANRSDEARFFCEIPDTLLRHVEEEERKVRLEQIDPWDARLRFLDVDLEEPESLVHYLNTVGLFWN